MSLNSIFTNAGALFCGLVLASLAMAQSGPQPQPQHQSDRITFETLENTTLVEVDFFETRFEEVVNSLQKKLGLHFIISDAASDNNLHEETLFTFSHPSNLRAATLLDLLLKPYRCTWTIQDGVIHITNNEDASLQESLNIMMFECGDLIKQIRPISILIHPQTMPNHQYNGGKVGGVFAIPPQQNETPEEEVKPAPPTTPANQGLAEALPLPDEIVIGPVEQLKKLITGTVSPDSWSESGGTGSIIAVNNVLVVRQTQANLRQINQLLEQLGDANLEN